VRGTFAKHTVKFVALNPNTTRAMTDAVVADLTARLPVRSTIVGLTARIGSPVICSRATFVTGAAAALALAKEVPPDTDGVLLACFGDPGLDALKSALPMPVFGLAQVALDVVRKRNRRFAIVTAGLDWVDMLRECVAANGMENLLVDVYALEGNGAQLLEHPAAFGRQATALSSQAADKGASILLLGGAAFAGLRFDLDSRLTVLDAMDAAAIRLMQIR
jgi:allantoin racemase